MKFRIDATCGKARAGTVTLPRGSYDTPVFMPVGTQATIKALSPDELSNIGFNLMLSNAYHLYLRPGADVVETLGGIQKFMAWPGLVLTDSGGFQVFSLAKLMKLSDEGIEFQSHIDGSRHFMSPEDNMAIQRAIGADMVMALDECPHGDAEKNVVSAAVDRTIGWAKRCASVSLKEHQTLIPIVQGGIFHDLREKCAIALAGQDFPAYAVGGLSVGEEKQAMMDTTEATTGFLPHDKPRYLMGVGMPDDIFEAVERGIDMFDCVLPTRLARNGTVFTMEGRINLKNACHKVDGNPIEPGCECYTCRRFSRSYLRHLFIAGEIMAARLATFHNLFFYGRITAIIRSSIRDGTFDGVKKDFLSRFTSGGNNGS